MADKLSGKPLVVDLMAAEMMKGGVAAQAWISHLVLAPPLIIEKQDIDFGVAALDRALALADQQVEANVAV
jgi:taurine--2-oxoglutarate transaminase